MNSSIACAVEHGVERPADYPASALDHEQVILHSRSRYLLSTPTGLGYNPIQGDLWLTNQRIIFVPDLAVNWTQRSTFGTADVEFPIKRVSGCVEQPMNVQSDRRNVLKLTFDNGGREYFELIANTHTPAGAWAAVVTKVRADAIDLNYVSLPTLKPGFEQPAGNGAQGLLLVVLLASMVVCLTCISALAHH